MTDSERGASPEPGVPLERDWPEDDPASAGDRLAASLARLGVDFRRQDEHAFLLTLPGERRHRTLVWLILGTHQLLFESFVCRKPDENEAEVFRFLLRRNARLRTLGYALDAAGDVHLVGRLGLDPLGLKRPAGDGDGDLLDAEIDTVLGVLLSTADEDFNQILERGFAGAIRREWAWRSERGQSLRNLAAFRHLIDRADR